MPSRPINQQATSGPDGKLQSVVCTAEQVMSCRPPLDESKATSRKKRAARTVTNLFHPGNHLFEKTFLWETGPVRKDQDQLLSQKLHAKSCHLTAT
ncbi:hypothetical protein VZT92_022355 [Zoarces viviparus]|uniref:Uncharacterized protein n=1 Tax=Zoarces viviparus TaxID=48416 RepID=A0AAW1EAP1_ZOAVI